MINPIRLPLQAHHPIALVYNELHPQWNKSIAYFLRWRRLRSLSLTFTNFKQLDTLDSPFRRPFTSLTSLSLKLRGTVDKSYMFDDVEKDDEDEAEENYWDRSFDCPRLQRLKLGRGKWNLQEGWAEGYKELRSLTLKHVDWSYVDMNDLAMVTPRLTEFVLYHRWSLDDPSSGPGGGAAFCFELSKAQTVRFYFPGDCLKLSLTFSSSLKAFSAMAKMLVLSCKTTNPLALQHLSLYGQQRLVISSLPVASVRVAYLNGPPKDHHSHNDEYPSYLDSPASSPKISPDRENVHCRSSAALSWAEWLAPIAPTVEVLIVRHGVPVQEVDAEWSSLRSLGIVVEREERFEVDLKVEKRRDDDPSAAAGGTSEQSALAIRQDMALSVLPVSTISLALARASGQSGYTTSAAVEARSGSEFLALRRDYKGLEVPWFMAPGGTPRGTPRGGGDEGGRGDGGGLGAFMPKVAPAIEAVRVVEGREGRAAGYVDEPQQG
ncbi:unnamed protein product [Closterium sp. Yama58-4]|nr:unnamed protein product [Closterium sp. Yama58-4]